MTEGKSEAAARALTTLLDFEAITAPLEKSVLEKLMRRDPTSVGAMAVSLGEAPEAVPLSWVLMTLQRPTLPGLYVVRMVWKTASIQLLLMTEQWPSKHWEQVSHWYGPLPLPEI